MQRSISIGALSLVVIFSSLVACGSDPKDPLWDPEAEQIVCEGESVVPLAGDHPMVISFLEIGELADGFDLDLDGQPDNKLAAVGSLARSAIEDAFEDFEIIIPFEFFDFETPTADECVKFAIYLGKYRFDGDNDDEDTAKRNGDCNDHDENIRDTVAEVADNFKDDDCDGLADETDVAGDGGIEVVPSDDTEDRDEDGVTIADGDCDDTNAAVKGPSIVEVCSDGFDNDCDGVADYGYTEAGFPMCSPYDETPDVIGLDPLAFKPDGSPIISFTDGRVVGGAGILKLSAGPSIFSVNIPVTDDLNLDLRISGARIEGDIVEVPQGGWALVNARLGGAIDANTADQIRGLDVDEIGLLPENSLLDAIFANILGPILALPTVPDDHDFPGCRMPDIDVDQDGLEAFCDSDTLDEDSTVDVCIDGDGTVVYDEKNAAGEVVVNCTEARDADGKLRFVDGISVEINLDTVPVVLPAELPEL